MSKTLSQLDGQTAGFQSPSRGHHRFHQLHADSTREDWANVREAIATCSANNITTTWTYGTGVLNGSTFLDADANRWVNEQQLLEVLEDNARIRSQPGKLDWAMTDTGSRKKTFTINVWTGRKYETREITAWFADRPMENQGP